MPRKNTTEVPYKEYVIRVPMNVPSEDTILRHVIVGVVDVSLEDDASGVEKVIGCIQEWGCATRIGIINLNPSVHTKATPIKVDVPDVF